MTASSGRTQSTSGARKYRYFNYHKVSRQEIERPSYISQDLRKRIINEVVERVAYTKDFYSNRFDERHAHWMRKLGSHLTTTDKVDMSLDVCVALHNVGA